MAGLLALALLWFNPFQGLSKYVSEEFYMRSIAAAYPVRRPRTLLILADDRTLAAASRGETKADWTRWPLPLSAWGAALDQTQARGAKLALLDVGLIDRRDPAAEREMLKTLRLVAETVDVFVVDPGPQPTGQTLAAWLVRNARSNRVHMVSPERAPASGFSTTYLLKPQRLWSPMAAVAMAHRYCQFAGSSCAKGAPRSDRIELWWPKPGCLPTETSHSPCSPGLLAALGRATSLVFTQSLSGFCENLPGLLSCDALPPSVLPGYAVHSMSLQDFTRNVPSAPDGAAPDAVIISQDFDLAQDLVSSPVYGDTPGAHAHAVAFDNLVTLGRSAITRAYPFGLGENAFLSLWIIAALTLGHALRTTLRQNFERILILQWRGQARSAHHFDVDRHIPAIVIAIMLLFFFTFCFVWSVSPANWLAAYAALGIVWKEEWRIETYVRSFLLRAARNHTRSHGRRVALFLARRR